jgi:hypothetical protein
MKNKTVVGAGLGPYIKARSKKLKIRHKVLASGLIKSDGMRVTNSFLSHVVNENCLPTNEELDQLAVMLKAPAEVLYLLAGRIPAGCRFEAADAVVIKKAWDVFVQKTGCLR